MNFKQFLSILFISVFCFFGLYGQENASIDSPAEKVSDSVNAVKLENYNKKLIAIEKQRVNDSIRKMDLEKQLNSLKTTDNLKKEELLNQIKSIQEKEANRIAHKKEQIASMKQTAIAYPVIGFFEDTLFLIYSKLGSFSAKDRANAITNRISKLSDIYFISTDSLIHISAESTEDLVFGDQIIMSISENDALWNNATREGLAEQYHKIIDQKLKEYKKETSISSILKKVGLVLIVIFVLWFLLFQVGKIFRKTAGFIEGQEGQRINGLKIKDYTLFDAKQEVRFYLRINTFLKWIIIITIIYIALPVLFGIFPWTKNLADVMLAYFLSPVKRILLSFWNFVPNLITIIVIIFVFRYVLKGLNFLRSEIHLGHLQIPGFYPDWANPTYQIIRVLVFAFMVIVIFPYLPGSDSAVFRGVSVFLGFLFTFGSAGSLSNIVAGLILTYMRLFIIGDRVKIGEVVGDVIEKSLLVTRVRTIKNEIISIPNSTVMNSHTLNYSREASTKGLIMHTTITIGYDVPWRLLHDVLIEAGLKTNLVEKEPKPFVLQTSLDDFYVSYQLNVYTKDASKQAVIYSELHQNIQDLCNESGIEILSPHYRATRDGNRITIPEEYLPEDYKAPSFNVKVNKSEDI